MTKRIGGVAVLAASALALAGCSTLSAVGDMNPFKKEEPKEVAGDGRRISIVAFDQKVETAEGLKGLDFYLPVATATANWPQPGGDPAQKIDHVEAAPAFEIAWRKSFGKGSNRHFHVTAPPILVDGRLYVMDAESDLAAVDAQTGSVIWRKTIHTRTKRDKRGFGGGVAWSGGKLYVSSGFRFVAQVDPAAGEVGWRRETASPIHGAPIVTSGRVFVISTDNELLTFDTATGSPGWTYQALVEPARILASSSPAAAGDTVIGAFASGEVVALRAANGNDLWNTTLAKASRTSALSEIRDVAGRPVVYEGDIYAASHSGVFAATDLRSGQSRWSLPVASISSPWPAGDVVYIVSQAGEVICASRSKGEVYWIRDLNEGEGVKRGNFFGIGRMEDKGGRTLWAGPVLASDRLILASSDGRAVALNAKTGEIIKTIDVGAPVLISPIAAGGMVYLVTDDAQLVAIR